MKTFVTILILSLALAAKLTCGEDDKFGEVNPPTQGDVTGTKLLKVKVTKNGDETVQVVDNQQGQVVVQRVSPTNGIRQTVFRNGVKVKYDVVPAPALSTT